MTATIINLDAAREKKGVQIAHTQPTADAKQFLTLSLLDDILRNLGLPTWEERHGAGSS